MSKNRKFLLEFINFLIAVIICIVAMCGVNDIWLGIALFISIFNIAMLDLE